MTTDYQGETTAERRRYVRKAMQLKVQFRFMEKDVVSKPQTDLLEDLGAGGLAMVTKQSLRKGQLLMISLELPANNDEQCREIISGKSKVSILSRVAWVKPNQNGSYTIGVEFLDLEPGERQLLKAFLIEYELDQPDSELYT